MADKVEGVACIQAGQEDETTPTLEWMRGRGRRRRRKNLSLDACRCGCMVYAPYMACGTH